MASALYTGYDKAPLIARIKDFLGREDAPLPGDELVSGPTTAVRELAEASVDDK